MPCGFFVASRRLQRHAPTAIRVPRRSWLILFFLFGIRFPGAVFKQRRPVAAQEIGVTMSLQNDAFDIARLQHADLLRSAAQARLARNAQPLPARISLLARAINWLYVRVAQPELERANAERQLQLN